MTDSPQDAVPLSHALGTGTMGQPPRARPSLKALAARVLEGARESVPLSHALGTGTVGQPPRARPSLKALAARVLEGAREPVPLSHAIGTGTVGQAVTSPTSPDSERPGEWDAADWRAFIEERAGIAEYNGGLSRADAERQAFECCVVEWLWRNPPPASGPAWCAQCSQPLGEPGRDGLPYLTGDGGHVWLHAGCHGDWTAGRRALAVAALSPTATCRADLG